MLRKDVRYMMEKNWEPKVPPAHIIQKQSNSFWGRLSGSVRLAKGLVVGNEYKISENRENIK